MIVDFTNHRWVSQNIRNAKYLSSYLVRKNCLLSQYPLLSIKYYVTHSLLFTACVQVDLKKTEAANFYMRIR